LYDPAGGTITVDAIDLREFDTTAWRREIGVIFQDYVQYNLTVRENIRLGNIRLDPQDERIINAARHAGADAFVAGLPKGYDTVLGKWFEDGEELSVGEWQKIALARAFLRDAPLLVLDEPTSAMDANAEYELFRQFSRLAENRTAILISHRFSTVRMADYIYVLAHGRIIEQGSHDELMHIGGTYARMFEIQARQYR
jgi:ATP-binding cassette subfamily B protein